VSDIGLRDETADGHLLPTHARGYALVRRSRLAAHPAGYGRPSGTPSHGV